MKEYEIVEQSGEFIHKVTKVERHPLFFTNHSLKIGKQYGILEQGLEQELFAMLSVIDKKSLKSFTDGDDVESDQVIAITSLLSLDHMKDVIWLAYTGAKTGECYDLEEFKEKYDEDFQTTMQVYMDILTTNFKNNNKPSAYKAGLDKFVGKVEGKK